MTTYPREKVMRRRKDIKWARITVKAPAMAGDVARKQVVKGVKDWAYVYEKRTGNTIMMNLRVVGGASESIRTMLNNTGKRAKMCKADLV